MRTGRISVSLRNIKSKHHDKLKAQVTELRFDLYLPNSASPYPVHLLIGKYHDLLIVQLFDLRPQISWLLMVLTWSNRKQTLYVRLTYRLSKTSYKCGTSRTNMAKWSTCNAELTGGRQNTNIWVPGFISVSACSDGLSFKYTVLAKLITYFCYIIKLLWVSSASSDK